jgi:PIN domain nuclease of toxin-antitoxin system
MSKLADDDTIRLNGIEALNKALGHADALRFLSLVHREPTDHVKISARLYRNQSVDDIFRRAEEAWRG